MWARYDVARKNIELNNLKPQNHYLLLIRNIGRHRRALALPNWGEAVGDNAVESL